ALVMLSPSRDSLRPTPIVRRRLPIHPSGLVLVPIRFPEGKPPAGAVSGRSRGALSPEGPRHGPRIANCLVADRMMLHRRFRASSRWGTRLLKALRLAILAAAIAA